ncbi:MAG: ATP-binding cassette domain-containing protein [Betaproteobacteria bacterium]
MTDPRLLATSVILEHDPKTIPESGLDRQSVLDAMTGLCGANHSSAKKLRQALGKLAAKTDNWSAQAKRLDRAGFAARHLKSNLREILALSGDLALLRLSSGGFILLHRQQQRWQTLDAHGEPLADVPDTAGDALTEAIVLRMPRENASKGGLDSLLALWPALRAAWAEVGLASVFVNTGQLLLPLFSMLVYDKVVNNGVFETLWALTLGMSIYIATDAAMRIVRAWSTEHIAEDLTRRGDESLWHRLVAQTDLTSGFARFLSNYRDLAVSRDFVSSTYLLAVADLPFLVLYLVAVSLIAWPMAIVTALLVLFYAMIGYILQLRSNRLGKEAEQQNTRKLTYMGEMLGSLDVVRTVPGAGAFLRRWRDLSDDSARIDGQRRLAGSHSNTLAAGMMTFSTVTMLVAGAYLIEARNLSVGGLIACNLLTSRAMSLVTSLFMVIGKWQDFQRAAARMESSLIPTAEREYTPRPTIIGNVAVIGLSKRYQGRPTALDGVSLTVQPGERIALLGKPGAGKTTLLRCVAGLCKPDSGQILIDGLALEDIAQQDRAAWMAWKSQDPALFAGTLEENLRVAGSKAGSERFVQALWASGLEDELKSGRMTLGMQLEERGGNLSGGQRQKVALARVLAQPSRILLLDEPTLGLDPDSERLLAERLPKMLGADDVLIMTTHSAIMLAVAQRVIALDGGHIIADGLREKLVHVA